VAGLALFLALLFLSLLVWLAAKLRELETRPLVALTMQRSGLHLVAGSQENCAETLMRWLARAFLLKGWGRVHAIPLQALQGLEVRRKRLLKALLQTVRQAGQAASLKRWAAQLKCRAARRLTA
jgi:hypothetical protein